MRAALNQLRRRTPTGWGTGEGVPPPHRAGHAWNELVVSPTGWGETPAECIVRDRLPRRVQPAPVVRRLWKGGGKGSRARVCPETCDFRAIPSLAGAWRKFPQFPDHNGQPCSGSMGGVDAGRRLERIQPRAPFTSRNPAKHFARISWGSHWATRAASGAPIAAPSASHGTSGTTRQGA